MISSQLQSQFKDEKLLNTSVVVCRVDYKSSELVNVLASKVLAELHRMAPYASYSDVESMSVDDLRKYFNTLIWMRVNHCNDCYDQTYKPYKALSRYLAVPVLLYQVLLGLGRAYDDEFNIEFRPAYTIPQEDLLSTDEMESVSSVLRSFEGSGLKVVYGLPRDKTGELDFMAISHLGNEVLSYRKGHPVYGFLAAFLNTLELNEVTGTMCRILYGYESDYRYRIDRLVSLINHTESGQSRDGVGDEYED